jgi:NAD(P)-dependent dehydrogenase (short-subunit alcohol dehydrogenase family)
MSLTKPRIRTKFSARSTADEVAAGHELTGTNAIITGGSSGIGIETARAFARAGGAVTLAVRNVDAGRRAAADIKATTGNSSVRVTHLELTDGESIQRFVTEWDEPLHFLINNAGIMQAPLRRTVEGWESQFATNHLGHFRLALQLQDYLTHAAAERGEARIVALTSSAHMTSPVDFDDIHFHKRAYDPSVAYSQSKTANALFAVEANSRWREAGIIANAVNPGAISTGLQRHLTTEQAEYFDRLESSGVFTYKTPQQGAATTLVAALAPEFGVEGGHYLDDGSEAKTLPNDAPVNAENRHGVKEWALDQDLAARLWDYSLNQIARVF